SYLLNSNNDWRSLYPDGLSHDFGNGITMLYVPAGCFVMIFSDGSSNNTCFTEGFWIAQTEMSQADYARLGGETESCLRPNENAPVNCITWTEAQAFCESLGMR